VVGLGGTPNGFVREDGFDIVVASEVMAILCLSQDLEDLKERLGRIIVAYQYDGKTPVYARDLKAHGAMAALLKEAIKPNLVQTLENNIAIIHGGPFANIAHGCNTVTATQTALKLADYVVTEAGFGADLGAEKFIDIKCRMAGLKPAAVVLVATIRALKFHGGVQKDALNQENLKALAQGFSNLDRHIENIQVHYGLPCIVAINHFTFDTDAELSLLKEHCKALGVDVIISRHWAEGGQGAEELASVVADQVDQRPGSPSFLYPDTSSLWEKIETIARKIYGAASVTADPKVRQQLSEWSEAHPNYPICMAKTQMSFSTDPGLKGAPSGHNVHIREVRLANGAGFVVAIAGDIMTMPGLPKVPAAESISIDAEGLIQGLF
jgi:formate--tetrahydrofolate ligase